jgi:hypothetical protein
LTVFTGTPGFATSTASTFTRFDIGSQSLSASKPRARYVHFATIIELDAPARPTSASQALEHDPSPPVGR